MRTHRLLVAVLAGAFAAATAFAAIESPKPEPPPRESGTTPGSGTPGTQATGPRAEAERSYALAYEEIAKAKKDVADGKAKNAEKKFRRAMERMVGAVALDSTYFEAWNLLGYSARKLGDYDRAFAAYEKCLAIAPDYAAAREYLGEAWLEKNDLAKARAQLSILESRHPGSTEAKTLRAAVDAWVAAHPEAGAPAREAAPVDSATAVKGGTR